MTTAAVRTPRRAGLDLACLGVTAASGEQTILHGVRFEARPGELVAVLGPSGAGKSTLIRLLTGYAVPTSGQVLVGGLSLADEFDRLRTRIGYVPQDSIVHGGLTVRECLDYAARLRLPAGAPPDRREDRVRAVIEEVGLSHRIDSAVAKLSGGQAKRVSIAVELLSEPSLLVLDEPAAGLDPATEARLMSLFRRLADAGRTVVLSTHVLFSIESVDRMLVLSDGRTAWFGRPEDALGWFGTTTYEGLFAALERRPGAEWEEAFRRRRVEPSLPSPPAVLPEPAAPAPQFATLVSRTARLLVGDRRNLAILLAQAPAIGLFVSLAHDAGSAAGELAILLDLTLAAIWFGAINSCREIVKERPIYLRERKFNLAVLPYYLSKFAVLSALGAVQAALLVATVGLLDPLHGSTAWRLAALFLACQSGLALGLALSAIVDSTDRAVSLVPIALIPQAILAGAGREFSGAAGVLQTFTFSKWGLSSLQAVAAGRSPGAFAGDLIALGAMTAFLGLATCVYLRVRDDL